MAKFNEVAYLIMDELKNRSDDAFFELAHILFLMLQYRSLLLKQRYTDQKKSIPKENYQMICVPLVHHIDCIYGDASMSSVPIPAFVNLNGEESVRIGAKAYPFATLEYTLISHDRFMYVGENKWLNNMIYFTIGPDNLLYFKSNNPNHKYLEQVYIEALFEDVEKALELSCDGEGKPCDWTESNFPLEASLIPALVNMILKELLPATYAPEDDTNDASDNLSETYDGRTRIKATT